MTRAVAFALIALFALLAWLNRGEPKHLFESWVPAADAFKPESPLWPPAEFRGEVASVVLFTGREGIAQACGEPPAGMVRLGCQGLTGDGISLIAIANPCLFPADDFFAGIMCHELAHANGWRHP